MAATSAPAVSDGKSVQGRILCVTSGLAGMLYSSVELARRLAAAGHCLTYASFPDARGLVEHHGLDFLPLDPSRYEDFLEADAGASALHKLLNLRDRRQRAADSMGLGDFARAVRDVNPDLILIDGEMHEHIISASASGVPMALLNTFSSIWRRPGLPPPHYMVTPGVGWKGTRPGISMLWLALRLRKFGVASSLKARRFGCDRISLLDHLARTVGFDLRRETDANQWLMPFTYRRLRVLSLHAFQFEFPHRAPEVVRYVGPMVLERRNDRPMAPNERAKLEAVLERRCEAGGGHKVIFAGFGSVFSTDRALLERLFGVVRGRPNWELVISLSGRVPLADLDPLPERVHAFSWVPQMDVLRHADAVVTHGGINTIDECVISGVPMLVYCGGETDMAGNTARIEYHGIGIAGDRQRDSTEDIRHHVDRLLSEPGFATDLGRLRQHYLAYAEDRVAERAIWELLDQPRKDRSSPAAGGVS